MISAVAFCPQTPLLVAELASGAAAELTDLRAACRASLQTVATAGRQLVVLGDGPTSQIHSALARGSLSGFGLDTDFHLGSPSCGGELELPASLTVGAWMLNDALGPRSGAMACSIGPDFNVSRAAGQLLGLAEDLNLALVVLGDGSARLSTGAPGYLDDRAEDYDDLVAAALTSGDGAALAALDAELGTELLVAGLPSWRAAAALLDGTSFDAELTYREAPFGVDYFVATWSRRG